MISIIELQLKRPPNIYKKYTKMFSITIKLCIQHKRLAGIWSLLRTWEQDDAHQSQQITECWSGKSWKSRKQEFVLFQIRRIEKSTYYLLSNKSDRVNKEGTRLEALYLRLGLPRFTWFLRAGFFVSITTVGLLISKYELKWTLRGVFRLI